MEVVVVLFQLDHHRFNQGHSAWKQCTTESQLHWKANRKLAAGRMAPMSVILSWSNLEGHFCCWKPFYLLYFPHLLLYLLVSFTFPFLTRFIYFLAFSSLPILPE